MKQLVLITGLDGSGKSTLIDRLEAQHAPGRAFLRLPVTDAEMFRNDPELYALCNFINELNATADEDAVPSLKIIALFASMLLFGKLHDTLTAETIVCERHPLIDTAVYGRIYASKMAPELLPAAYRELVDQRYALQIRQLLDLLPERPVSTGSDTHDFLAFIYDWFAVKQQFAPEHLAQLFPVPPPDRIVYLQCDAKTLLDRLADRKVKEAHENQSALEKMVPLYDRVLHASGIPTDIIAAVDFKELDRAFERFNREL